MISLFLGLSIANLASLLATIALGYAAAGAPAWRPWHTLAGAMASLLCVGVHCVVFTYFVATAKWVRHAVLVKKLDDSWAAPTRSFKALAFPAALLAIFSVFAAAVLGAAVDNRFLPTGWHHAAALIAFGVNLVAAAIEYGAITRNGDLIDRILAAGTRGDATASPYRAS